MWLVVVFSFVSHVWETVFLQVCLSFIIFLRLLIGWFCVCLYVYMHVYKAHLAYVKIKEQLNKT